MIPELMDRKWYEQIIQVNIDRVSLLKFIGCLMLVLKHPDLPKTVEQSCIKLGNSFALTLLNDGLILPDEVRRVWEKMFNIPYQVDPNLIIPGLTNQKGRPWK